MSFFTQLIADAKPKSVSIRNFTTSVSGRLYNSVPMKVVRETTYTSLVNVTAVALPVVERMQSGYAAASKWVVEATETK